MAHTTALIQLSYHLVGSIVCNQFLTFTGRTHAEETIADISQKKNPQIDFSK
jgi:hypothetical protein